MDRTERHEERAFRGIWIPSQLWLDKSLNYLEKFLLAEIDSLSQNGRSCFASNAHLADLAGVSERHIQRTLETLREKRRITSEIRIDPTIEGGRVRTLRIRTATTESSPPSRSPDREGHGVETVTVTPATPPPVTVSASPGDISGRRTESREESREKQQQPPTPTPPAPARTSCALPRAAAAGSQTKEPDGPDRLGAELLERQGIPRDRAAVLARGRDPEEIRALIHSGRRDPTIRKLSGWLIYMLSTHQPLPVAAVALLTERRRLERTAVRLAKQASAPPPGSGPSATQEPADWRALFPEYSSGRTTDWNPEQRAQLAAIKAGLRQQAQAQP